MKNRHIERLRSQMRHFHRQNPWRQQRGLYIPHTYPLDSPTSWWDDVGFIHGGRRVMVWWAHPRRVYVDQIEQLAFQEAGPFPEDPGTLEQVEKLARSLARSTDPRGTHVGHRISAPQRAYLERLDAIESRLQTQGVDIIVRPSMFVQYHPWGLGMSLCVPTEVRDIPELRALADLAKRLLKREVTLKGVFPDYGYGRAEWVAESVQLPKPTHT
jgi:hypothetical protein